VLQAGVCPGSNRLKLKKINVNIITKTVKNFSGGVFITAPNRIKKNENP